MTIKVQLEKKNLKYYGQNNEKLPNDTKEQDEKENEEHTERKEILRLDASHSQNGENLSDNKLSSQRQEDQSCPGKSPSEDGDIDSSNMTSARSHTHDGVSVEADMDSLAKIDDNCPICIANRQGTILKTVDGEMEAIEIETSLESAKASGKEHEAETMKSSVDEESNEKENEENHEPVINQVPEVHVRPKSSLPSSSIRLRSGDTQLQQQVNRPKSAMESYSYYVITNPPNVVANGTKARMNDRYMLNGASFYKTDFQQQREEAWKRATRSRRPQTAAVMTSSHIPPPQRPSSPILGRESHIKGSKFKLTRTDRWLGGGRDLFWESVRKRPKSGHVPGWKEGLPESMRKKQRPVTAHSLPMPRANISRPGSTTFVSACSNCSPTPYGYPVSGQASFVRREESDRMFIMPQSQAIPQQVDPRTRVVTSPVSDEDEQIFLEETLLKEKDLFIQGVAPYTVPHPRKFTYLPYDTDFYAENDFEDYNYNYRQEYSSSYQSPSQENLRCDTPSHFSGDYCPPPSPHDKGGVWEPDVIDYEQTFATPHGNSTASTRYKLCSYHEKMFMKGDGNVIIYVVDPGTLQG